LPCCQDGFGLLGCGTCGGTLGNARGDQDAAELGEHVLDGGLGLGGVPGLGMAAGGDAGRAVTVPGVPDDDQGVDEQGERDGALGGAAGAAAGLPGAENVAGAGEGLLDGPPAGVAGNQGGGAGGQVGGGQGGQAGVAAGEDDRTVRVSRQPCQRAPTGLPRRVRPVNTR
jgi:hypothetical protein